MVNMGNIFTENITIDYQYHHQKIAYKQWYYLKNLTIAQLFLTWDCRVVFSKQTQIEPGVESMRM